jgi:hypothetical protein
MLSNSYFYINVEWDSQLRKVMFYVFEHMFFAEDLTDEWHNENL